MPISPPLHEVYMEAFFTEIQWEKIHFKEAGIARRPLQI